MNLYIILLFVLAAHASIAQHLLIKKDGQHIPYKKLKPYNDYYLEAIQDNKVKVKVLKKEVIGYFDGNLKKVRYNKPIVKDNQKLLFPLLDQDTVNGLQSLERDMVGKINLYRKEVITSGSGATATSAYYYYAEKDDQFKNVFITGFGRKKDDLIALKSVVNDNDEILKRIEAENFILSEKNMLGVINEYNLATFIKPKITDYNKTGIVYFYTTVGQKLKESITLKVNDSIEYKMPTSRYPLPIKLPLDVPSKVCVTWETGTRCDLIQPIPFANDSYEVNHSIFEKSFEIKSRTARELEAYIKRTVIK